MNQTPAVTILLRLEGLALGAPLRLALCDLPPELVAVRGADPRRPTFRCSAILAGPRIGAAVYNARPQLGDGGRAASSSSGMCLRATIFCSRCLHPRRAYRLRPGARLRAEAAERLQGHASRTGSAGSRRASSSSCLPSPARKGADAARARRRGNRRGGGRAAAAASASSPHWLMFQSSSTCAAAQAASASIALPPAPARSAPSRSRSSPG